MMSLPRAKMKLTLKKAATKAAMRKRWTVV